MHARMHRLPPGGRALGAHVLGGDELGANANFRPLPGDWRARAQRARHGGAAGQESGEACASRLE